MEDVADWRPEPGEVEARRDLRKVLVMSIDPKVMESAVQCLLETFSYYLLFLFAKTQNFGEYVIFVSRICHKNFVS